MKFKVPPLLGLFAEAPPPREGLLAWESEAALFMRWALLGPGRWTPSWRTPLTSSFLARAASLVTEQVFAECFGFRYPEMERRLEAFIRVALAKPTSTFVRFPDSLPEAQLKEATSDQIGRILGDWLRMQGDSLRRTNPDAQPADPQFRGPDAGAGEQAGQRPASRRRAVPGRRAVVQPAPNVVYGAPVAMKPFIVSAAQIHDPGLLAVFGLYEHDIGNAAKAREFLEAALRSGARRPMANVVLAELRYSGAVAGPSGRGGRLSASQAAAILNPEAGFAASSHP